MEQPSNSARSADQATQGLLTAIENAWIEAQLAFASLDDRAVHEAVDRADRAIERLTPRLDELTHDEADQIRLHLTQRFEAVREAAEQALAQCTREIRRAREAQRRLAQLITRALPPAQIDEEA